MSKESRVGEVKVVGRSHIMQILEAEVKMPGILFCMREATRGLKQRSDVILCIL